MLDSKFTTLNIAAPIEVYNPVTGEVIDTILNSTPQMVEAAVNCARAAQPVWAAMSPKERAKVIRRFADLLLEKQDHIINTLRAENGKNRSGALGEIIGLTLVADYYARNAPKWLKPESRVPVARLLYSGTVYRKPYGVVGVISPWNYPLILAFMDAVPALLAGNAIVLKPSEITPFISIETAKLLYEAGLPEDVFQIVTGAGQVGAALIDYVDYVMFTGSTATGRKVAVRAAERLIPFSLELGGNDPLIVLDDADIEHAAAHAVSAGFENAGQLCMSVERVMVDEKIYAPFLEAMGRWQSKIRMGSQNSHDIHMGSMTNYREFERTRQHIADAVEKGARLISGGSSRMELGSLFHEPTILADVTPDMAVMQEETFGPVIAVTPFKTIDEAVQIANDTNYGLSASVFGKNIKRAKQVALRIESGDVNINTVVIGFATPSLEFGGVKDSGFGRRGGKQGLLKYTSAQSLLVDNFPLMPDAPTLYTQFRIKLFYLSRWAKRWLPFIGT